MGKDGLMMLRSVRTGFLLIASLIAGRLPFPEQGFERAPRPEWEHISGRCASDNLPTLAAMASEVATEEATIKLIELSISSADEAASTVEAPSDSDWNHVDERYYGLRQLYEMFSAAKPEVPAADRK
jgi:hypothetical protein